jgi:hypothetical protein
MNNGSCTSESLSQDSHSRAVPTKIRSQAVSHGLAAFMPIGDCKRLLAVAQRYLTLQDDDLACATEEWRFNWK